MKPLLEIQNLYKSFGNAYALKDVSFEVGAGEIVALLGQNGAGKSTLIKILAGVYEADRGAIRFEDRIIENGQGIKDISFIHQDLGLINWMSIEENIAMTFGYPMRYGMINRNAMRQQAESALSIFDIHLDPSKRIRSLSRAEKALVAIARAVARNAKLLVLDEPTASLHASDVELLFSCMKKLKKDGVSMIYVTHRLDEIFAITDRCVVLRDGAVAGEMQTSSTHTADLIKMIVGAKVEEVAKQKRTRKADYLCLRDYRAEEAGPVTTTFALGEIVGLAGLTGAGHEVIAKSLFGLVRDVEGHVDIDGLAFSPTHPSDAIKRKVAFISGDRIHESTAQTMSVAENTFLNPQAHGIKSLKFYSKKQEEKAAFLIGKLVALRPNTPGLELRKLSGGNQQKVVVGRWLDRDIKIFIFEDPTAGVDIGARADIYNLFEKAAADDRVVLIVSSDFEEIAKICDRALVFDRGKIVKELAGVELTVPKLLEAASGGLITSSIY